MTKAQIAAKAKAMTKAQSIDNLVEGYELTGMMDPKDPTMSITRGWIMDELEARDEQSFWAWIDSNNESPRAFFLAAA